MIILVSIVIILTSIEQILEKCVHLRVIYARIVTILASIEQVNTPIEFQLLAKIED